MIANDILTYHSEIVSYKGRFLESKVLHQAKNVIFHFGACEQCVSTNKDVNLGWVLVWKRRLWGGPKHMLPAIPKDVVVDEVKLHTSSVSVDHKRHVICLHDLVVPEFALPQ